MTDDALGGGSAEDPVGWRRRRRCGRPSPRPARALAHGDVPDRRRRACATVRDRRPPQRAGADRRPDRARRGPRPARRRRRRRPLAARRLHALRDARALRDVRRAPSSTPASAASSSARPTPRPAPSAASTTSPPTAGSTTARRSPAACWPTSAATCCGRSSPNGARHRRTAALTSRPGRMPERTNGTASKAVEVLRASVGSNPTPSATVTGSGPDPGRRCDRCPDRNPFAGTGSSESRSRSPGASSVRSLDRSADRLLRGRRGRRGSRRRCRRRSR